MRRLVALRWLMGGCCLCVSLALAPRVADAQWFPYSGGYYPYGGWYGYGFGDNFGWNTTREIQQQDRLSAQARAAAQEAIQQQSIRSALQNDAMMRNQAMLEDRRGARDWWLSEQDRQMGLRQGSPFQMAGFAIARQPAALGDQGAFLIAWPRALRISAFLAEIQRIEAPFARFACGGPPVCVGEYENMLGLTACMRHRLSGMSGVLTAYDFLAAQQFLDRLDGEAQCRISQAAPQPTEAAQPMPQPAPRSAQPTPATPQPKAATEPTPSAPPPEPTKPTKSVKPKEPVQCKN